MNRYASPMKIFEMAACGIPILLSDIEAHKELEQFNLGLVYYDSENFNDFSNKLENLLLDSSLRSTLSEKSLKNIHIYLGKKEWIIYLPALVAQLDRASDFGSEGCGFESYRARFN